MASVLDYIDWRGDLSFSHSPCNDVDNVIFSELSYINLSRFVPADPSFPVLLQEALRAYFDRPDGREPLGAFISDKVPMLAEKILSAPRFSSCEALAYRNMKNVGSGEEDQLQWAAITFRLDDGSLFIAFCGTDDTIISWKEDLHMAYTREIPSQRQAADYFNEVAAAYPGAPIRVGGHSKGGNLAIYAAAKCDSSFRDRILAVYSNDGPGFHESFLKEEGFLAVRDKIRHIVPDESLVGLFLGRDYPQTVIRSKNKSLFQHDTFSWEVERTSFVAAKGLTEGALKAEKTVKQWLLQMSEEETRDFVNALYSILTYGNAETLTDIIAGRRSLLRAFRRLDPEDRAIVADTLRKLFDERRNVLFESKNAPEGLEKQEKKRPGAAAFVERLDGASLYRAAKKKK